MTPDTLNRLAQLRMKSQEGTISLEEMKEAIRMLREDRANSARTSRGSTSKAAKAVRSADDILSGLDAL